MLANQGCGIDAERDRNGICQPLFVFDKETSPVNPPKDLPKEEQSKEQHEEQSKEQREDQPEKESKEDKKAEVSKQPCFCKNLHSHLVGTFHLKSKL